MEYKVFDAYTSKLVPGINLLEASAGTGKTYTIAMLVLRFVVEHGLDIKELLVVTFTKAATEELKTRIRARLVEAKSALSNQNQPADVRLQQWLQDLAVDTEVIRSRIDLALLDIDQAAIFTIHGFCQRVLTEHALESGQIFDSELSGDIASIKQACADDFWRKQLYLRPAWQVNLLTINFTDPEQLLSSINNVGLHHEVYPDQVNLEDLFTWLNSCFAEARVVLPELLSKISNAFPEGKFNESYQKKFYENQNALLKWLANPDHEPVDFAWLTHAGVLDGLNGRKFMVNKTNQLSSQEQKLNYLDSLAIDCSAFTQLADAVRQLQVMFRCALLQNLREEIGKRLQQKNLMSFDDLISRLADALTGKHAALLITHLQQRFKVALLDEFQDTDSQQWQIFSQIFAAAEHYMFLIGDPKQAIYKFRGADIFSYFVARQQAQHVYTLEQNWRSHPGLVAAVNTLFARPEPFFLPELAFNPVVAGLKAESGGLHETAPMVCWQLDKNQAKDEYWQVGKAGQLIRNAIVNEILALILDAQLTNQEGSRKVTASDIAILVRNNQQALDYQQALQAQGIPAVLNSKLSVFASQQAKELYVVLHALSKPGDVMALKQALTLDWFNLDGQALNQLCNNEAGLDVWLNRFQEYYQLWLRYGLLTMMQSLLQQEQVELQFCRQANAERVLTNLHHLLERLQQASIDEHLAVNKTVDWLLRAIQHAEQQGSDDQQLRLESDADAVKIVTLHSAKGLEYAIVFCPNLWQRSERLQSEQLLVQCHENGQMVVDLGSEQFAVRREQALQEELAEDLRLLYVAVTRAKYRCYVCWADVRTKAKVNASALAYLLAFSECDFAAQQQKFQDFARQQPVVFAYRLLSATETPCGYYQSQQIDAVLNYRRRQRTRFSDWQMSSYTGLTALSLHDIPELPVDKAVEGNESGAATNGLPKGAQTGNVVHYLLEHLNFQTIAKGTDFTRSRELAMQRFGLRIDFPEMLDTLLQNVVHSALSEDVSFCLKNLDNKHCIKEMPFYLAMPSINTGKINQILADSPAYQPLSSKQMRGFLTGFIDLVCCYQDKYYVIDYKTNSLADYSPESIILAMREHNYGLQYWLYAVVLDAYLQQRLPGYHYQQHFGGVKYLFVRGMSVELPGYAVFSDLPAQHKILELSVLLLGEA